jgi:hypothetical protein
MVSVFDSNSSKLTYSKRNKLENSVTPQEGEYEGGDVENQNRPPVENISEANQEQNYEHSNEIRNKVIKKQSEVEDIPEGTDKHTSDERIIEKFFRVYWNYVVSKLKWVIIAFVIIWAGIAIWRITEFKPATEAFSNLSDSHWLKKLQNSLRNDYHTGENDDSIKVSFVWGVKGVDKNGVGKWDSANRGTVKWDTDFDLAPEVNQQRVVDICSNLRSNELVKQGTVTCWIEDFLNARNGGSPVPKANFYTELDAYLLTTNGQNYYNDNQIGYINNTLYFIKIDALSVAKPHQGYSINYPVYEDWEDLKDKYNDESLVGINKAFQTAESDWAFLISEQQFVQGAIQGTIIALSFAFGVLVISTLNIIVAVYATLSIS